MPDEGFTPEPMSAGERLKKNLAWLFQGFVVACLVLVVAFGGMAAYGALFAAATTAIQFAADLMFSGFVTLILFAAAIIPTLFSNLESEAGVLRALGASLGLILIMGLISEVAPVG